MKQCLLSLLALTALIFVSAPQQLFCSDVSVTAANVQVSTAGKQFLVPVTFGEAVTAGQLVYQKASDRRFYLADANDSAKWEIAGVAVNGGAAGQDGLICTEDPDFTPGFTLDMSAPFYVASATAGGIAPVADATTGWNGTVVMVAKSTTKCQFRARGHAMGAAMVAP